MQGSANNKMPVKLTYFTLKALAEPIRYMLSYCNIEFDDIRLDADTWKLSVKYTAPFGTAPILEIDGKTLTQHKAICRYMAREAGIASKDDWEELQIDIIVDTLNDLRIVAADYKFERDEKKKADKKDPLYNETLPFYFEKFEAIANENNGYLANKKFSWADIYFVAYSEHMCFLIDHDILEPYPSLKALRDTVHAIPGIKKYIENRPPDIMLWFN